MTDITEAPTAWLAGPRRTAAQDDALAILEAACTWNRLVKSLKDENSIDAADGRLRDAIDAAREAGVAWGTIGDRLGLARGNAYQKYRRRPAR